MNTIDPWLHRLTQLKVDRATGDPAPHKPLLLLVVLDLAGECDCPLASLHLTPELVVRFSHHWPIVAHRRRRKPDPRLPFHHLSSDGFWTVHMQDGEPSPHERVTRHVRLHEQLVARLEDPAWRQRAKQELISSYFRPEEQIALRELHGLPQPSSLELEAPYGEQTSTSREQGREARFRIEVVSAYRFTCALTRYRLMTMSAGTIVDAAHIHQFADSRNNEVQNGIALCKNAHWMFDEGLWSISDDYRVIVASNQFAEDGPAGQQLRCYHGSRIELPANKGHHPGLEQIRWHRKNRFLGDGESP